MGQEGGVIFATVCLGGGKRLAETEDLKEGIAGGRRETENGEEAAPKADFLFTTTLLTLLHLASKVLSDGLP